MATPGYELVNGKETGDKLYATEVNSLGDTLDFVALGFAEWLGSGCLWADGFDVTAVAGELAVMVSANLAIVGQSGRRVLVAWPGGKLEGLYPHETNRIYILSSGSLAIRYGDEAAPEESELVATATTDGEQATAVQSNPEGRTNLLGVHAARVEEGSVPGYLGDLIVAADASIEVAKDGGRLKLRAVNAAADLGIVEHSGVFDFDLPAGERREVVLPHPALSKRLYAEMQVEDSETGAVLDGIRVLAMAEASDGTVDDGSRLLALVEDVTG